MTGLSLNSIVFLVFALFCASFAAYAYGKKARLHQLNLVGLWVRVVAALVYLGFILTYYGVGDFLVYDEMGRRYADQLAFDSSYFFEIWSEGKWYGSGFVAKINGVLYWIMGPTVVGASIVFAVLAYGGVLALISAFRRAFPAGNVKLYAGLIILWPSIWFWPSTLGKDALVLLGIGITTLGFVGRRGGGKVRWMTVAAGAFVVSMVRPQVMLVVLLSMLLAHWLAGVRHLSPMRIVQGVVFGALGMIVLNVASNALGYDFLSPAEIDSYLEYKSTTSARGGSAMDQATPPWLAPINTLFRPFPWEAQGTPGLLACLELYALWGFAWYRRRALIRFVQTYRRSRVLLFAAFFALIYASTLGIAVGNVGIIVRQRVHLLPFLIMFIAGVPRIDRRIVVRPKGDSVRAPADRTARWLAG